MAFLRVDLVFLFMTTWQPWYKQEGTGQSLQTCPQRQWQSLSLWKTAEKQKDRIAIYFMAWCCRKNKTFGFCCTSQLHKMMNGVLLK